METDAFYTLDKDWGPIEIKEKGSRFIGYIYPVDKMETAMTVIDQLWKHYHDATHVCFAVRLGQGKENYRRYSDAGEPSGTAGLPIYREIVQRNWFNVLVGVVRYFGGIKLGTGGLSRAYAQAARGILSLATPVVRLNRCLVQLEFAFEWTGEVMNLIHLFSGVISKQNYSQTGAQIQVAFPQSKIPEFHRLLSERTRDKGKMELLPSPESGGIGENT